MNILIEDKIKFLLFFFLDKNNIPYFETSAKEGINVEKAFETVARNALARDKEIDQQADFPMPIRIPQQEEQPKKEGCAC
jgi:Ras-related protein Rab-7A